MASFPANLFQSFGTLSPVGQHLLVVNNLKGISEKDRANFKTLALKNDPRTAASIEAFIIDHDVNSLVSYWKSLIAEEAAEEAGEAVEGLGARLNRDEAAELLDSIYKRILAVSSLPLQDDSRDLAERTTEELFNDIGGRDGRVSFEELKAWFELEAPKPKKTSAKAKVATAIAKSGSVVKVPAAQVKAEPGAKSAGSRAKTEPEEAATPTAPVKMRSGKPAVKQPEPVVEAPAKAAPKKLRSKKPPAAEAEPQEDPMKKVLELRDQAGLQNIPPQQIVNRAKILLAEKSKVNEAEFVDILINLHRPGSGANRLLKENAIKQIFHIMDFDQSGSLEREELLNALTAISGGSEDDKIEAIFMLYDENGDGLISFEEMLKHQSAVFRMAYSIHPEIAEKIGESAETMAQITTESIFKELDADNNRVVSQDEFKAWYKAQNPTDEMKEERKKRTEAVKEKRVKAKKEVAPAESVDALKEVIAHLGLTGVHVADAMALFKEHGAGIFSRQQFKDTLHAVIQQFGNPDLLNEEEFNVVCAELFTTFDVDQSSTVDMQELFSGLSVLCEGTPGEKLRVAFELYDESGDGFIQYGELVKYLTAVFRVVTAQQGRTDVNVDKMASATAKHCFEANGQEVQTGKLSFVQFKEWHDTIGARI